MTRLTRLTRVAKEPYACAREANLSTVRQARQVRQGAGLLQLPPSPEQPLTGTIADTISRANAWLALVFAELARCTRTCAGRSKEGPRWAIRWAIMPGRAWFLRGRGRWQRVSDPLRAAPTRRQESGP
jgi:hypothetical protein